MSVECMIVLGNKVFFLECAHIELFWKSKKLIPKAKNKENGKEMYK